MDAEQVRTSGDEWKCFSRHFSLNVTLSTFLLSMDHMTVSKVPLAMR